MSRCVSQFGPWGLGRIPVLILLAIFTWLDAFKLMSLKEILLLLVLGGVAAIAVYPISGRLIDKLPIGFSNYSRFVAPWIEEAFKASIVIMLFGWNRIGYKLDAVISGFAIGAGFSVVENIIYLTRFPDYAAGTWLVRGIGTAVMHGTTLAILAAIAHELSERETREAAGNFNFSPWWFIPGFVIAAGIHTLFNQFPERPLLAMLGAALFAPIAIMAIFTFGTSEAQQWLEKEYAGHKSLLETLRSGKWGDVPNAARLQQIGRRLGPDGEQKVRRYFLLLCGLVVEAEETMIEQAAGKVVMDKEEIASGFAELDALDRSFGRLTAQAIRRLLPFSRNDYWEVSELRQRL